MNQSGAWLLFAPATAITTTLGLLCLELPRRRAIWAGIAAGAGAFLVVAVLSIVQWDECLADTRIPEPPPSWPWSPRRTFCDDGSTAANGSLLLLLIPAAAVAFGAYLRWRGRRLLGWAAYAPLLVAPFLPHVYVNALAYYRLDSYPILQQPLLRPAAGTQPARVCYVYGIAYGARKIVVTGGTVHTCVELERTPLALGLTATYDEGRTIYDLEWMGKNLTQRGLPVRPGPTGIRGLVVRRAYTLTDRLARAGATPIG